MFAELFNYEAIARGNKCPFKKDGFQIRAYGMGVLAAELVINSRHLGANIELINNALNRIRNDYLNLNQITCKSFYNEFTNGFKKKARVPYTMKGDFLQITPITLPKKPTSHAHLSIQ